MNGTTQDSPPVDGNAAKKAVAWCMPHWARLRLGHEGMMLDKIQRQNRIVEIDARNAMTNKPNDIDDWPGYKGDDAMGVKIGDEIHNHYPPPQEEPPAKNHVGTLVKAAIVAGLLGGPVIGTAVGVGVPWLMGMFDHPAAVDTDTQYELRIGPPETLDQP